MAFRWVVFAITFFISASGFSAQGWTKTAGRNGTGLYILLGLGNASPGLAEFGYSMRKRYGIPTAVANYEYESVLARDAIDDYRSGRVKSIKIIGHSLGADAAVLMANDLARAGVPVQLVVTLDPVFLPVAPSNARHFVKFVPRPGENHFTMIAGRQRELTAYILER